jgi:hypothetical protein
MHSTSQVCAVSCVRGRACWSHKCGGLPDRRFARWLQAHQCNHSQCILCCAGQQHIYMHRLIQEPHGRVLRREHQAPALASLRPVVQDPSMAASYDVSTSVTLPFAVIPAVRSAWDWDNLDSSQPSTCRPCSPAQGGEDFDDDTRERSWSHRSLASQQTKRKFRFLIRSSSRRSTAS